MSAKQSKMTSAKRRLAVIMLVFCLAGAGILGYMAWQERQERRAGELFYAGLAQQTVNHPVSESVKATESTLYADSASGAGHSGSAQSGEDYGDGAKSDEAVVLQQDSASEVDFEAIRQTCKDVVGWLQLKDSVIDYPVVQGQDNAYYLNHLPDGTPNESGSIMMDQANSNTFADAVTILHGHNMHSGAMFGDLDLYADEAYYRAHPVMHLFTPEEDYKVCVFAAYTVDGNTFDYATSFSDEAAFKAFIQQAMSETPYDTGITVNYGDRIILLSTCAYSYKDARFVVLGKLESCHNVQV